MMSEIKNPFSYKTPEQNSAQDVVDMFVDVFTEFYQVLEKGHTFLNGARGSGKSMMFRYIMPDCQMIAKKKKVISLDFFSLYVPIKLTDINIPDLGRLESHAEYILNEHLLATYVLSKSIESIINVFDEILNQYTTEIAIFYKKEFLHLISFSGYKIEEYTSDKGKDYFRQMAEIISQMNRECNQYCKSIALSRNNIDGYYGSIIGFMDFVYPFLIKLKQLPFFPPKKPLFMLIDDAGYLNLPQTKVLNTWVSYRTIEDICFKISTQLDYKTYLTINGKRIDSPHDYSGVNILAKYTSTGSRYYERIEQIVKRRIHKYLTIPLDDIDVRKFFPEDEKQKQEIEKIASELREQYKDSDKDYAANDAVKRYSVPEYIKKLKQHRSGSTYNYAGFDQLVAISSGVIRCFLEPAYIMFAETLAKENSNLISCIPDSIQDKIIKQYSIDFLSNEFDKIRADKTDSKEHTNNADMLYNLVDSLGQLFHKILVSDAKDRRVFSIALTDRPNEKLKEILELGEQYGYLHKSTIGNKQGTGRNRLYILNRLLAPYFKLDPMSFAGYQFMDSDTLTIALSDTAKFLKCFSRKINVSNDNAPSLFDNIENFHNDEDY
jgi:hypothetical protein